MLFRSLFGDPYLDYSAGLQAYYDDGAADGWRHGYISAYASAHPLEDWAECFAHYLHMRDTLQTAADYGLVKNLDLGGNFELIAYSWRELCVVLNELNRSLGIGDAYPFVINSVTEKKLAFVHECVLAGSAG